MRDRVVSIHALSIILVSILTPLLAIVDARNVELKINPILLKKIAGLGGDEKIEVVVRLQLLPREIALNIKGNY